MFRHIKQSTKKTLINKTSTRLLGLEFKSDNIIKSKAIKLIIKKYCLIISTLETYCVNCEKHTANENSSVRKTKQNKLMLLSNCVFCGNKKSTLLKTKNSIILMISLKLMKPLTNIY